MVQVEAAHEHLVRLTASTVLREDHPRHHLQDLTLTRDGPDAEVGDPDESRRRRGDETRQVRDPPLNGDGLEGVDGKRVGFF